MSKTTQSLPKLSNTASELHSVSTIYTDDEDVPVYFRNVLYERGGNHYVRKQLYIDGWAVSVHDVRFILATVYQYIQDSADRFYATSTRHTHINCKTKTIVYHRMDTIFVEISLYPNKHSTDITVTLNEFLSIVTFVSTNISTELHEQPSSLNYHNVPHN